MPNKPAPRAQLLAENAALRARLEQAETTLTEILGGDADALFISGVNGAQVFTLKDADQSYRTLIENMSEGALTLSPDGLVLYANRRFAEMLGAPLEKVIGSEIFDWTVPENVPALQTLLQKDAFDNRREELALAAADGTQVPVYLSVNHLVLDGIESVCMVVTDLTEKKRNEAILAAEKLSNAILEQAADAIVICDQNGRIMRASKQAQALCGKSPLGQQFEQAFPLRQPDGAVFSAVGAIDSDRGLPVEARLTYKEREYDLLVSVGHLKGARDVLLGSVITMTDITERKTAERALQKSEKQLSEALTIARIGYWEYEFSTDEFIFNDQYYLLHKMTAADAGGYRMSSAEFASRYTHPEDAYMVGQYIRLAFESSDPDYVVQTEARLLNREGGSLWVEVRFGIQKDLQGNTVRLIGVNQDITARKQNEQDILYEKQFSDTLIQSLPAIFFLFDQQGNLSRWNDNLMELTGRSPAEMAAANALDFVDEENQPRVALKIREAFETGSASIEVPMATKDGVRLYAMSGVRIETRQGVNVIGIGIDITERQKARDKLLESRNLLQLVVESVPSRIFWKDSDLRYLGCNTRFAKDAGLSSPGELTGKTDFEMTWKDQAELYRNDDKAVMESGTARLDIIEPQTTPDGNTIWLQTSKVPLRDKEQTNLRCTGSLQ